MTDDEGVGALAALAAARRTRRTEDVDWFDQLYRAYLTIISVAIGTVVVAGFIGDRELGARATARVVEDGPALAGIVIALLLLAGARSGARGGPLALEAPFVQHVLLAPVDRDVALREPAIKLFRQAAIAGGIAGVSAGLVAAERLPQSTFALVAGGAVAGAAATMLAAGIAMVVAGSRVRMGVANLVALPLVVLGALDVVHDTWFSPATWFGRLAMAGAHVDVAPAALALALTVVGVGAGLRQVGATSVERALARAGLVSSMRLAVTRQDLRAVVLLHRRLGQDHARARPWVRIPSLPWAVPTRGLRSIARLPARRLVRMGVLAVVATIALAGVWQGTVPLVVAAALALHGLAVDAVEALAQEVDHPEVWASYPIAPGGLLLQHLVAPALALLVLAAAPIVAVVGLVSPRIVEVAAVVGVCASVSAVVGAAASIVSPPFEPWNSTAFVPPEAMGMRIVFRVAWPVIVTGSATIPMLIAAAARDQGDPAGPAAVSAIPIVGLIAFAAGAWIRSRSPERL